MFNSFISRFVYYTFTTFFICGLSDDTMMRRTVFIYIFIYICLNLNRNKFNTLEYINSTFTGWFYFLIISIVSYYTRKMIYNLLTFFIILFFFRINYIAIFFVILYSFTRFYNSPNLFFVTRLFCFFFYFSGAIKMNMGRDGNKKVTFKHW